MAASYSSHGKEEKATTTPQYLAPKPEVLAAFEANRESFEPIISIFKKMQAIVVITPIRAENVIRLIEYQNEIRQLIKNLKSTKLEVNATIIGDIFRILADLPPGRLNLDPELITSWRGILQQAMSDFRSYTDDCLPAYTSSVEDLVSFFKVATNEPIVIDTLRKPLNRQLQLLEEQNKPLRLEKSELQKRAQHPQKMVPVREHELVTQEEKIREQERFEEIERSLALEKKIRNQRDNIANVISAQHIPASSIVRNLEAILNDEYAALNRWLEKRIAEQPVNSNAITITNEKRALYYIEQLNKGLSPNDKIIQINSILKKYLLDTKAEDAGFLFVDMAMIVKKHRMTAITAIALNAEYTALKHWLEKNKPSAAGQTAIGASVHVIFDEQRVLSEFKKLDKQTLLAPQEKFILISDILKKNRLAIKTKNAGFEFTSMAILLKKHQIASRAEELNNQLCQECKKVTSVPNQKKLYLLMLDEVIKNKLTNDPDKQDILLALAKHLKQNQKTHLLATNTNSFTSFFGITHNPNSNSILMAIRKLEHAAAKPVAESKYSSPSPRNPG